MTYSTLPHSSQPYSYTVSKPNILFCPTLKKKLSASWSNFLFLRYYIFFNETGDFYYERMMQQVVFLAHFYSL